VNSTQKAVSCLKEEKLHTGKEGRENPQKKKENHIK